MAELIIYAGHFDPKFLVRNGASQSAAGPTLQHQLKKAAATARLNYRKTIKLRRRLDQGDVDFRHLDLCQQRDLQMLEDGSLLRITNHAVAAYAHGTLREADDADVIGGLI